MIQVEDRRSMTQMIEVAHRDGERLNQACEVAGIDLRTLQRWKSQDGFAKGDGRPDVPRPMPRQPMRSRQKSAPWCWRWPTSRGLQTCHRRASCPRWPMRAPTWPVNPPSAAASNRPGRTPIEEAPRTSNPSVHRKPMWPPPPGSCCART